LGVEVGRPAVVEEVVVVVVDVGRFVKREDAALGNMDVAPPTTREQILMISL
jgi:hypothetical protein